MTRPLHDVAHRLAAADPEALRIVLDALDEASGRLEKERPEWSDLDYAKRLGAVFGCLISLRTLSGLDTPRPFIEHEDEHPVISHMWGTSAAW